MPPVENDLNESDADHGVQAVIVASPPPTTFESGHAIGNTVSAHSEITGHDEDSEGTSGYITLHRRSRFQRIVGSTVVAIRTLFRLISLVAVLAFLAAIPLIQLIAFGYLLDVAGRLTRGGTLRESVHGLDRAGSIGLAVVALFVASLPVQLLVHWESVAAVIDPGSDQAIRLRSLAILCAILATVWLLWVWARGGTLTNYLWPEPKRFLRQAWRPSMWSSMPDRLWEFTVSLELPRLFWLGARGFFGTLVCLLPAMIIMFANRNGTTPLAGLVGVRYLISLGIVLLYLPMLQAHFAAENRLRALFDVLTVRQYFLRAPWAWFGAMLCSLVLMPIPLYLLKIEATPQEVVWLPSLFFVAFMLPARISAGLALRRASRQPLRFGFWPSLSRWTVRVFMVPVVGVYLLFLALSQYTSWEGLQTWVQQHAILVPVPFVGI